MLALRDNELTGERCQSRIVIPAVRLAPVPAEQTAVIRLQRGAEVHGDALFEHVVFADGSTLHAPETINAYRESARFLPQGFGLLYLHQGVQAQCQNPLLPSLIHLTGHDGPVHALRREGARGIDADVLRFARAMTPPGGATLILDDPQVRVGAAGQIRRAILTLTPYPDRQSGPTSVRKGKLP